MRVALITHTPDPEGVILQAYLSCRHKGEDIETVRERREDQHRIRDIFLLQHFGLFEHATVTIRFEGVSRSFSHQLVRHRIASYAQLSMRHVDVEKLDTIVPPSIAKKPQAANLFIDAFNYCREVYSLLKDTYGIRKEDARFIIPIGIETQVIVTMNFRSWLHFLKLRTDISAQWEIREAAGLAWEILKEIAPNVFDEVHKGRWE